ncbi:hypothetical protein [Streptomyces nojiriensis]|uniref:hypothetical protein n=1 Tax=Streptomyces nojiriensis TaxID=66374 RepID=UPI0035D99D58
MTTSDGGIVREDPAFALKTALWKINLANGAAGPGQRPVIVDGMAVKAEAIVLESRSTARTSSKGSGTGSTT